MPSLRAHALAIALGFAAWACTTSSSATGGTTCASAPACGGQVEACTTTDGSGACTQALFRYDGKDYACSTCADCTGAAEQVARACAPAHDASVPPPPPPGDAAPEAGKPTTTCTAPTSCASGDDYQICTTTLGASCLSVAYRFDDATLACASCSDCSAAVASALAKCNATDLDAGFDSGPTCGTAPVLHPEVAAGPFCPFTDAGFVSCAAGQTCCDAPLGSVSSCVAAGAACPVASSSSWACEDAIDCASSGAGPVCCGVGSVALDAACGFRRGSSFTGSHCAASCGAGEVIVCESNAQCPMGKTCQPFKTQGLGLGVCL